MRNEVKKVLYLGVMDKEEAQKLSLGRHSQRLKKIFPRSSITIIAEKNNAESALEAACADKVIMYARKKFPLKLFAIFSLLRECRKGNFDLAVIFYQSTALRLFFLGAGIGNLFDLDEYSYFRGKLGNRLFQLYYIPFFYASVFLRRAGFCAIVFLLSLLVMIRKVVKPFVKEYHPEGKGGVKKRLRIIMLNHNFQGKGGTYFRCLHFGRELSARGHMVTLLTTRRNASVRSKVEVIHNVTVISAPKLLQQYILVTGWDVLDVFYKTYYVLTHDFDLLVAFAHKPNVALPAYVVKVLRDKIVISDWCDWWTDGGLYDIAVPDRTLAKRFFVFLESILEKNIRRDMDAVTVIAGPLKERAVALGVPEGKVRKVLSGAAVDEIYPIDKAEARRKLGIGIEKKCPLYMGLTQFDSAFLLRAFERLVEKCSDEMKKDLLIIWVGPKFSPREEGDAERKRKLVDNLFETGFVPFEKLKWYLAAADVHLVPLEDKAVNRGRYPNKIGDYVASGRPTISTPVGEVKKVFEENEIGILSGFNEDEFADTILEVLENKELAERLGKSARKVAEEKLSWKVLSGELEKFYLHVIANFS